MLTLLLEHEKISNLDIKIAQQLTLENSEEKSQYFYLVLLLSVAMRRQHTCLDLNMVNWQNPFSLDKNISPFQDVVLLLNTLPELSFIGENKPLIIRQDKLYFARYDYYEAVVANKFNLLSQKKVTVSIPQLKNLLEKYFVQSVDKDWQKVACAIAAISCFSVITGGPGTGKTTTVTKLLVILQSLYQDTPLTIKLVAPTGKAAARLSESIQGAKIKLKLESEIYNLIPETAQTLHRLLGVIPKSNKFRHNKNNPLHVDLLIIDEASMVDLAMMAKLILALPEHAKLILLGDKDQLTSVDTGNVLSDLCQSLTLGCDPVYSESRNQILNELCFATKPGLSQPAINSMNEKNVADCIAFLQKSHRFDAKSGIGQLAKAINTNDTFLLAQIDQQMKSGEYQDVTFYEPEQQSAMISRAANAYSDYLKLIKQGESPDKILSAFSQYQVLAAVKEGVFGVKFLNEQIELALTKKGVIKPNSRHYLGMPIMITQNDYQLGLFNGDIGILLHDETEHLKAMFISDSGKVNYYFPARLPAHEKTYAMTIHKSQGSEFNHVVIVLPPEGYATAGINRQLVYTGITRAKHKLDLIAHRKTLLQAMGNNLFRTSGLYERLM